MADYVAITTEMNEEDENKYVEKDDSHIIQINANTRESHDSLQRPHSENIDKTSSTASVVIKRLYDGAQSIPKKAHTEKQPQLNNVDPHWKYNITLGDLELRRITHYDGTQETLWFPMQRYPDDYKHSSHSLQTPLRKVFISFIVKRVSDVSNINETFRMRFNITFHWLPTETDYKDHYRILHKSKTDNNLQLLTEWEPKWYPHIDFQNMIQQHFQRWKIDPGSGCFQIQKFNDFAKEKHEEIPEGEFDCVNAKFIVVTKECEMTFAEELELQSFPFDCQDLSCIIHERITGGVRCVFLPNLREKHFANIDPRYSVIDEWDLDAAILEFGDAELEFESDGEYNKAMIVLRLKVKRRWKVFFANIVLLMACIAVLALTVFSLDAEEMGDRLNLLITLILTTVAFNHVVFFTLPNVPYLTFIDRYILGSYGFLVVLMVESACIRQEWFPEDADTIFMYLAGGYIILHNIAFFVYGWIIRHNEIRKMTYSSDQIEKEVNMSRPELRFDYTQRESVGKDGRLLSFIGYTHASEYMNEKQKRMVEKKKEKIHDLYETEIVKKTYARVSDASEVGR